MTIPAIFRAAKAMIDKPEVDDMKINALLRFRPNWEEPIASLTGPFIENAVDLNPEQLRAFASLLNHIVDDAQALPRPELKPLSEIREYYLGEFLVSAETKEKVNVAVPGNPRESYELV